MMPAQGVAGIQALDQVAERAVLYDKDAVRHHTADHFEDTLVPLIVILSAAPTGPPVPAALSVIPATPTEPAGRVAV